MDPHPLEMEVKKIMCKNAKVVVALIDSTKFDRRSLSTCVGIDEIDYLVTDENAPKKIIEAIISKNVDVTVLK